MADDPDNLILRMLRELRGKPDEHDTKFARIDERFAQIDGRFACIDKQFEQVVAHVDERFDDMKLLVSHALGLSTATDNRSREHDARLRSIQA